MDKAQQSVNAFVLVDPTTAEARGGMRAYQGMKQACYGVVVSVPDEYSVVKPGDEVWYHPDVAIQAGNYVAIEEEDVISKMVDNYPKVAAESVAENPTRAAIFGEVDEERRYQGELWGDDADDSNTEANWKNYIDQYNHAHGRGAKYRRDFRKRMVKVAALAVAAIEAHDRTTVDLGAGESLAA